MEPTQDQITQVIDEVVKEVEEVRETYDEANCVNRLLIRENIANCYKDSCKEREEVLSAEDFIEDMDNSIGWYWIEDPIQ